MSYLKQMASYTRIRYPCYGKLFFGLSGISIGISIWNYLQIGKAEKEIQFRKNQLSKPIYQLTEIQMINPPWNKNNLHQWLYRRVIVTGKPIHRLQCLIPRKLYGHNGYECVVPLVGKQNQLRTQRYGILFSRGFFMRDQRKTVRRHRVESVDTQTFLGFVSTLPELAHHGWTEGNALQKQHVENTEFTHANLKDMVRKTGLMNVQQASVALVESLQLQQNLDQRSAKLYNISSQGSFYLPASKTQAGALQLPSMPWDFKNRAKLYCGLSLASFIVGVSFF